MLEGANIPYMLTGSVVSSLQGEPRSTHDIDMVVAIRPSDAKKIVEAFPAPDFYLDEESIVDAIKRQGMFNLLDVKEGDKVDFWLLTDEPFDRSRFSRKYIEEAIGISMQVSSPEDTILMKLRWCKLSGGSEKQFTDAMRVYEVQSDKLDKGYLEYWVKQINVETLWKKLMDEAEVK